MKYKFSHYKDFLPSKKKLHQKGGKFAKAVERSDYIENTIRFDADSERAKLNRTNHGENRIKNCEKYDLRGACRLITVRDNGVILFCFIGTHDSCDNWLQKNRGFTLTSNQGEISVTEISPDIKVSETRITGDSRLAKGLLIDKLDDKYVDELMSGVPTRLLLALSKLESTDSEDMLYEIVSTLETKKASVLFDVFCLLRQDEVRKAIERLKVETGENKTISELTDAQIKSLVDSDNVHSISPDDHGYDKLLKYYLHNSNYMDWMLFLHPEQNKYVQQDYKGPAKLIGVSGSGKTCVMVLRAIRLAKKYPGEKILLLTLNRSLARLISDMVCAATLPELRENIEIKAFFEVCQEYLTKLEPENNKLYNDVTWKSEEHIDEIWSEYYRCELNNHDARIMTTVHDSLISREIDAQEYIREEFDWIRSAVINESREDYYSMERRGRSHPLDKRYRSLLLDGLLGWEKKMFAIGVTDYLGLSVALYKHIEVLTANYRCVLVDESQDFGTIELGLIRKLVNKNDNDIFLCGDVAQKISYKHQSLIKSGIDVPASRSNTIVKNYRNSKEILKFANQVLWNNLTDSMVESEDFPFLDPEYAELSGTAPLVLRGNELSMEIQSAYQYLVELISDSDRKGCIAICGYTLHEIVLYAKEFEVPVLNETASIGESNIFFTDLEQTKGFEFDYVCILNCNDGVLPNSFKPAMEQIADLSRLYVTMTRAKLELVISYTDQLSFYIAGASEHYLSEEWGEYLDVVADEDKKVFPLPKHLDELKNDDELTKPILDMSGSEFLYQEDAIGLPVSLIKKIREKVDGKGRSLNNRPIAWKSMKGVLDDLDERPSVRLTFGMDTDVLRGVFKV